MNSICVFCGSSAGKGEAYLSLANDIATCIAKNNKRLVYGGASIGLMGAIADSALAAGGKVLGVIPSFITKMEIAHSGLTELKEVESMHERKKVMYDESDAFVALPGGIGTLDELCEIATWQQLGLHRKPIYILNTNGFFDSFLTHLDNCVSEGFLSIEHRELFEEIRSIELFENCLKS